MNHTKGGVVNATTKRALRDAVKTDPSEVVFYSTNLFTTQWSGKVSELPQDMHLTVAGPVPQEPTWWATIHRARDGHLVVQ